MNRMFICVAVVAFTLLSCNDTGLNSEQHYEHYPVMIADDVQKWMDEQLASKGSEKKLILISDMYISTNDPKAPKLSSTVDSKGNEKYFLNNKEISAEEYIRLCDEILCKRNLDIPGEILSSPRNCVTWTVLMTAEELTELLSKKYDDLSICFKQDEQEL